MGKTDDHLAPSSMVIFQSYVQLAKGIPLGISFGLSGFAGISQRGKNTINLRDTIVGIE